MTTVEMSDTPKVAQHDLSAEVDVRFFALGSLYKAPENVRKAKSDQTSDTELEASIESQGLIGPLVIYVDESERGAVMAGGRRLAALMALKRRGLLTKDSQIPCICRSRASAVELSLAENIIRAPMHPSDEFVAYQKLVKSGVDASEIAVRYGQSNAHVERILRLSRVHRTLFTAFRKDELSLPQMMAYAAIEDKKQQKAVFDLMGADANEWRIRNAMTEGLEASDSAQAKFVTVDSYLAAGGAAREDMFTNKHYLCDLELLSRLAVEKLETEAESLRADGWGWIEVTPSFQSESGWGRIHAELQDVPEELATQIESLGEQIEQLYDAETEDEDDDKLETMEAELRTLERRVDHEYRQFAIAEKSISGCVVCIGHDGELTVLRGLVKPEDKKRLKALSAGQNPADGEHDLTTDGPVGPKLSKALVEDLGLIRRTAIRASLAQNPTVALTLLHFQMVDPMVQRHRGLYYLMSKTSLPLDMQSTGTADAVSIDTTQSERWENERLARIDALDLSWAEAEDIADRFARFTLLSKAKVQALVAVAVAESLSLGTDSPGQEPLIDAIAEHHLKVDFPGQYRPCSELYFSRLTKAALLELGTQFWGDSFAGECKTAKKGHIVARVAEFFSSDDSVLSDEQRTQRDRWLPEQIVGH